jgi:hypothetical protein
MAYQFRLVCFHTVVHPLSRIEVPPIHQISAAPRLGICSLMRLNGAGCYTLHCRRFFATDDLAVYQPDRDDLQPLPVTVSHRHKPLSVQGDPNVVTLAIRLQPKSWHHSLPSEMMETVMPQITILLRIYLQCVCSIQMTHSTPLAEKENHL